MCVMFVTRLHKAIKNKKGKHPVVLQITWDRNVRRKRTGIWASPNQLFIDDDGKARLREIDGKKSKQKKLKLNEKTAKRISEDDYEEQEFDYNEFCEKLDSNIKLSSRKKTKIKVAEFCAQVSDNFKKSGQIRSSMDYNLLKELIPTESASNCFADSGIDILSEDQGATSSATFDYNHYNPSQAACSDIVPDIIPGSVHLNILVGIDKDYCGGKIGSNVTGDPVDIFTLIDTAFINPHTYSCTTCVIDTITNLILTNNDHDIDDGNGGDGNGGDGDGSDGDNDDWYGYSQSYAQEMLFSNAINNEDYTLAASLLNNMETNTEDKILFKKNSTIKS